jgi:hypothetical protein
VKQFLFDPRGAQRVRVATTVRTVQASPRPIVREGWLVAGTRDRPPRVYFTDGDYIAAPADKNITKVDFLAACRARYAPTKKDKRENDEPEAIVEAMDRNAVGIWEDSSSMGTCHSTNG